MDNADQALIAFINCEQVDLQNGSMLLMHKLSHKRLIVAPTVPAALEHCKVFRTLADHASVIAANIPQLAGQEADVINVLTMVQDAGLMTTAESIAGNITGQTGKTPQPAPTRVFIITCDRPDAVKRLLESMLHSSHLTRHQEIFLVDDSRKWLNGDENREAVEKFNLTSAKAIRYLGADQHNQLLQDLVSTLPDHERAIRFLIDRDRWAGQKSYGLARTVCLLLSVGRRAIIMDDDVLCSSAESPHSTSGIAFGDNSREMGFYTDEEQMLSTTIKTQDSPLTGHAQCLGLNLSQAIKALGVEQLEPAGLAGANAPVLGVIDGDSPVLITQNGSLGDTGSPSTNWFFQLGNDSIQRMLAAPGGHSSAQANRHYWLGRSRPTFTKVAVMSQVTGLDNSHCLPPYFPVFRGEDYIFGAMVEYLYPRAVALEYDWCVPHLPVESRGNTAADKAIASSGGMELFARYITDHTNYEQGISFDTRLDSLCALIRELAESSDPGLHTLFQTEVLRINAGKLKALGTQLQISRQNQGPRDWLDYLQNGVNELTKALQEPAGPADSRGIPEGVSEGAVLEQVKEYAGEYAAALKAWPAIRDAAGAMLHGN